MHPSKQPPGSPVLPDDALPCVWMAAGLVTYKLCNRDFDCESCPLDVALRRGDRTTPRPRAPRMSSAHPLRFPSDRAYHPSHRWLLRLDGERLRCGLDAFAARLLDRIGSVVLPAVGAELSEGDVACWIRDAGEMVPLTAPVSGTVAAVNDEVRRKPALANLSPYTRGWLMELDPFPGSRGSLLAAGEIRRRTADQIRRLRGKVAGRARSPRRVGRTLADGGEPATDWRAVLGTARYHRTILPWLT